jgi:hypothetical protein
MNNSYFSPIHRWILPESVLADSLTEMAHDGAHQNEGVMLWLGHRKDGQVEVSHLVALRGPGVIRGPYLLQIESVLLNDVADLAIEHGASLVGQIHSHGGGCSTDLSVTDGTYGFAVPYYLSVVAPDYGLRPNTTITDCGVHVFEPVMGYRRLTRQETLDRIYIVPGPHLPLLIVGEEEL